MSSSFHQQYLACIEEIERRFPVAEWRCADLEVWPLARMDLYLDMYWQNADISAPRVNRARRAPQHACAPVTNLWRRRNDLRHHRIWPHKADAIFLGDGVSLDCIDGAWQDRYSEPLIASLEQQGRTCFLMQPGDLRRSPWQRETFPANMVDTAAHALVPFFDHPISLPALSEVQRFFDHSGIAASSLSQSKLLWRANTVRATAAVFERVLEKVQPRIAFVTTWYAGLAPAFLLACRRRGILSVDLQHCPQGSRHKAYTWWALPARGYKCLPALLWTWDAEDAEYIQSWARASPWHRAIHGGHPRLADDNGSAHSTEWDAPLAHGSFERDILIALQTVHSAQDLWHRLAREIAASPPSWRWWIRRHPAARPADDRTFAGLLALHQPNVCIEEASALPLWALLPRMSVVVSHSSGAGAEAAALGVHAFFLSADASGPFGHLIEARQAIVCDVSELVAAIATLPARPIQSARTNVPPLEQTLRALESMATDYRRLCRSPANESWPPAETLSAIGGQA